MLLSEKDAKYKHCPFLTTKEDKFRFCLGSQCMMWRWKNPEKREEGATGYCGMAGRPAGAM